jgi:transcription-repair coupling factor (superfamily II helicase)
VTTLTEFFAAATPPRARLAISGAPEGHDALVLGGLVAAGTVPSLLHVCRDDGRMARTKSALAFFHPGLEVLTLPAWDCLPYDRVSPNAEIVSRRIDTLTRLAGGKAAPRVVLTTVNAVIQRVPPRALFADRVLRIGAGGKLPLDRLAGFLGNNGYGRTDTVREAGEFAVRGGIVDLYPSGASAPVRLDFFGDTIEGIRSFDALTQRSTGSLADIVLRPVSEVLLDDRGAVRHRRR